MCSSKSKEHNINYVLTVSHWLMSASNKKLLDVSVLLNYTWEKLWPKVEVSVMLKCSCSVLLSKSLLAETNVRAVLERQASSFKLLYSVACTQRKAFKSSRKRVLKNENIFHLNSDILLIRLTHYGRFSIVLKRNRFIRNLQLSRSETSVENGLHRFSTKRSNLTLKCGTNPSVNMGNDYWTLFFPIDLKNNLSECLQEVYHLWPSFSNFNF